MAIATAAAIGLGVAGIGSALSASSQKKAANKAADTSLEVARQNNALAGQIYGENKATLSPYVNRGNAAGDQINALLGLGGTQQVAQQPQVQPNALAQFQGGQMPAGYGYGIGDGYNEPYQRDISPMQGSAAMMADRGGSQFGNRVETPPVMGGYGGGTFDMNGQQVGGMGANPQQAANNAFDIFRNSTGYQFRLGEGMNALNSGYAGAGTLQSGAAIKDAVRYGQDFASNEFGNYMGYLGNQQGAGLSAAGAQAGVGVNYVGQVSQNNNNAGSAVANAALVKGQNNPFANALGMVGGGLLGGAFG